MVQSKVCIGDFRICILPKNVVVLVLAKRIIDYVVIRKGRKLTSCINMEIFWDTSKGDVKAGRWGENTSIR